MGYVESRSRRRQLTDAATMQGPSGANLSKPCAFEAAPSQPARIQESCLQLPGRLSLFTLLKHHCGTPPARSLSRCHFLVLTSSPAVYPAT